MDPLTHTAVGLFLSRSGLNRFTPRATAILILASNVPDIDIVTAAGGSLNYLHFHRHLTHSLLLMPAMALLPVAVVRLAGRQPVRWLAGWAIAVAAVAIHLLLDLTNIYGIRLLLPFSAQWLRLDLTSVIDLWIWSVFLLAVAAPFLARLVSSEITSGASKRRHHGRGWAVAALAFLLLYDCGRAVLHGRAQTTLQSRIYQDAAPIRTAALPDPVNPWKWSGLVETRELYAVADMNLATGDFDPERAAVFHKPDPDPALDAARAAPAIREFLQFSQFPLWRITPVPEPENGKRVDVYDMRFGTPAAPGFLAWAVLDSRLHVVEGGFQFGGGRPR
jgi:inner membrane protein